MPYPGMRQPHAIYFSAILTILNAFRLVAVARRATRVARISEALALHTPLLSLTDTIFERYRQSSVIPSLTEESGGVRPQFRSRPVAFIPAVRCAIRPNCSSMNGQPTLRTHI